NAAGSSRATRTSSSQSRSSGVNVTRPRAAASAGPSALPKAAVTAATADSSSQNRVRKRDRPLAVGYQPSLASESVTVAGGSPASSMNERSEASSSSASVPAKHEPGSTRAISDLAVRSSRDSTRAHSRRTSRTSQWLAYDRITSSTASTAAGSPSVRGTRVAVSGWSKRRGELAGGGEGPPRGVDPAE